MCLQMGTNYKAALIPQRIRETIHGWKKAARKHRRHGNYTDDSTIHTETSTVMSIEEDDDHQLLADTSATVTNGTCHEIELQSATSITISPQAVANETSSRVGTPLLRPSASVSLRDPSSYQNEGFIRSSSMPNRRE